MRKGLRIDVFYQAEIGATYWHVRVGRVRCGSSYYKSDSVRLARRLAKELGLPLFVEGKRTK